MGGCKRRFGAFFGNENRKCGLFVALVVVIVIIILVLSQLLYFTRSPAEEVGIDEEIVVELKVCEDFIFPESLRSSRDTDYVLP